MTTAGLDQRGQLGEVALGELGQGLFWFLS
jgi:hypothetical protein